jgi:hypothetical protein
MSSEDQHRLFDKAEQADAEQTPTTFEELFIPAHTRGKRGRQPIPADLPRVEVVHDLPEAEKTCACGCALTRIGEEVSEKLDSVPAKIQVLRHVRYKYACRGCEGVASEGGAVKTAPLRTIRPDNAQNCPIGVLPLTSLSPRVSSVSVLLPAWLNRQSS